MSTEIIERGTEESTSLTHELTRVVREFSADPKDLLRRFMELSALRSCAAGILLVEKVEGCAWLSRYPQFDAPLRSFLREAGHPEAVEAHAVDAHGSGVLEGAPGRPHLAVLESPHARVVLCLQSEAVARDESLLAPLRMALQAWNLRREAASARRSARDLHRRVSQVRAGMRAGRRIERAFEDMDGASRWLLDLGEDFGADAVMALVQTGDGEPLLLSAAPTVCSLETELTGWVLDRFEKEHQLSLEPGRLRRRSLSRDHGSGIDEILSLPPRAPQPDHWPSRVAVPFTTAEGRQGLVALGSRVPQNFAPEAGGLLRGAASSLAHGISRMVGRERQRRRLLQSVLEHLPLGLILVGEGGSLLVVNAEAMRLLGLKGPRPRDVDELERAGGLSLDLWVEEILSSSEDRVVQEVLDRRDGLPPLHMDARRIPEAEPGRGELLLALRDVSEEQRRERARSEFVNTVGHELKTPLTSMVTAVEILAAEEAGPLADDQRRFVDLTARNLQRLEGRIEQLLMMARQEAGRLVLHRQPQDLVALLATWLESTEVTSLRQGRDFRACLPAQAQAFVDSERFPEVVENLVGNAFKFTPRDGSVHITLRTSMPCPVRRTREMAERLGIDVQGVELEVVDDGAGMSAQTAHHAFDPFYQEGDPLADRPEGAGLGLAIVRSLVEAHDGEIEVQSEVGQGTCMRVWVPCTHDAARLHGGLRRLRHELDGFRRRGDSARLDLLVLHPELEADLAGLDQVESETGLLVRLGGEHLLRVVPGADTELGGPPPRASVSSPEDGRRLGMLLAELMDRSDSDESPLDAGERSRDE